MSNLDTAEDDILTLNLDISSIMDVELQPLSINEPSSRAGSSNAASAHINPAPSGASVSSGSIASNQSTATTIPTTTNVIAPAPRRLHRVVATAQQLKYIKSLLGASSRLGRALAELFGLLVKLCVSNPRNLQNANTNTQSAMAASRDIARVLSYILVDGLAQDQLPASPIPKLKQTFLICSIGFTSPMLFNDKHYAYHLMLHYFVEEDGLLAFFDMFNYAMAGGYTNDGVRPAVRSDTVMDAFPDGCGEFLDAWLMLLEKMVNTKAILESPHVIAPPRPGAGRNSPNGTPLEFDTIAYLAHAHRSAFVAVRRIWNIKPMATYGTRMTESMMSIMRHVIKSEKMVRERYAKRTAERQQQQQQQAAQNKVRELA